MLLIIVWGFTYNIAYGFQNNYEQYMEDDFPEKGYKLYSISASKSHTYFSEGAEYFKEKGDTTNLIICLAGLSDIEKRQGRYNRAFDILKEIQKNYIRSTDFSGLIDLNLRLGRLYGIYGQDSLALSHHKTALAISKQHRYYKNETTTYFSVAEQYAKMSNYDAAISYLDSCYLNKESAGRLTYVDSYYAYSYMKKGDFRKAQIYLKGLVPIFEKSKVAYLAKIYAFFAELKAGINQPDSALYYYQKSLQTINSMKVHHEIKPMVLEQLAYLHNKKGNTQKAYQYMVLQKEISDSLFNLQSNQNKELFEVKREYLEDLSEKEEMIQTQKKIIELSNKASIRLKVLLGIVLLMVAIGLLAFRQRFLMRQLVTEKKQNDAIIELKNKELTANTLQFIEKENAITELLDLIKEHAPEKHNTISNQFKQSNKKVWDDFHLRFTQINSQFYDRLMKRHPTLTQTDLKHCALIKLNFDSKEMSLILGISLHSVHVARSRIRKKLGLNREDSLSGFLGKI